jgi:ribosomal protein S18 acetylase RimI-like enzyme
MALPEIRLLAAAEAPEAFADLARLHAEEISSGFLTSLGTGLLARLYGAIGRSPDAFILTASANQHIVGFLCASTDTRRVYRYVLVHAWRHLLPALARHLLSWRTLRRCWETLRYPARSPVPDLPGAEILNFCVTQKLQRSGVGRALFSAMEGEYRRRGVRCIRIVTGANQLSAIRFYEKLGAEPVGTIEVHARTESRLFRYSIQDCHSAPSADA